jgi:uncharacterized membrane protein YoaK (UPF0700 family)
MFRHKGKTRTQKHNLKVASLLSFVAGLVNVVGFLAVQKLTTNVTGHFAFFVDEFFKLNLLQAFIYCSYILFFLFGSFVSNFIVEMISRKSERFIYIVPVSLECLILFVVGLAGKNMIVQHPDLIACSLLFSMGLQNSLVTQISNSVVRTTHLTGLFTDLGIELSQLFFYKYTDQKKKLFASIRLRITIISFFFIGGIAGGVFYSKISIHSLFIGAAALFTGMIYDEIKFKVIFLRRKLNNQVSNI